jgi:isochorismate synthase
VIGTRTAARGAAGTTPAGTTSAGTASTGTTSRGTASAGTASTGTTSPAIDVERGLGERLATLLTIEASGDGRLDAASAEAPDLDPIALFAAAAEAELEAALWLQPAQGLALVGVGRAWAVEDAGPDRFASAERAWRRLIGQARIDVAAGGPGPVLLGALGFSGRTPEPDGPWAAFGPSSLVLPELLFAREPAGSPTALAGCASVATSVTASLVVGPEAVADARRIDRRWAALSERARALTPSPNGIVARPVYAPLMIVAEQPDAAAWHRLVGSFAGAVGRGRLDKVVLARRVDLRSPVELDVPNALRRLAASAPESTIYAFRRDGRTFLGATPERLIRTAGRTFRTVAVAGTIGRGRDAAEDVALAAELLGSEKDREEHAIVVASIRDLLAPLATSLTVAPQPAVMTLRHVQHLVTEIEGTLPEAAGLLALGGRLHPTPAVGGEPRELALELLGAGEGFDRGWYAGPIGWLGADGDGELCVALRCGIVDHTRATLFAGCGIVADSDPDAEWEESRIKLRAVVSALGTLEDRDRRDGDR